MAKRKALTQAQVIRMLAEESDKRYNGSGLSRDEVKNVLQDLANIVITETRAKSRTAPGVCPIPFIGRVKTRRKPAVKARKGINPFTGEETTFKARPATTVVKILPAKKLKDQVNS